MGSEQGHPRRLSIQTSSYREERPKGQVSSMQYTAYSQEQQLPIDDEAYSLGKEQQVGREEKMLIHDTFEVVDSDHNSSPSNK